jgi:hypothetical protein
MGGAPEQPARLMRQSEFEEHVSPENVCANITKALERARQLHEEMTSPVLASQD